MRALVHRFRNALTGIIPLPTPGHMPSLNPNPPLKKGGEGGFRGCCGGGDLSDGWQQLSAKIPPVPPLLKGGSSERGARQGERALRTPPTAGPPFEKGGGKGGFRGYCGGSDLSDGWRTGERQNPPRPPFAKGGRRGKRDRGSDSRAGEWPARDYGGFQKRNHPRPRRSSPRRFRLRRSSITGVSRSESRRSSADRRFAARRSDHGATPRSLSRPSLKRPIGSPPGRDVPGVPRPAVRCSSGIGRHPP